MKASLDQEKTRIEIPASRADEDEAPSTIMDTICGSGENRIMFRLSNFPFIQICKLSQSLYSKMTRLMI